MITQSQCDNQSVIDFLMAHIAKNIEIVLYLENHCHTTIKYLSQLINRLELEIRKLIIESVKYSVN